MKMVFLDPNHRLSIDTFQLLRRLRIEGAITYSHIVTNTLVIVANGTPDNEVIAILLHTLNGKHTIALAFPKYKRASIAKYIHLYVNQDYNRIAIILDQEQEELQNIYNCFKQHTLLEIQDITVDNRIAKIRAQWYSKQVLLTITVNGLDDHRFTKHTIEDHLITIAERIGILKITGKIDPKREWNKLKLKDRIKVYKTILTNTKLRNTIFKKHLNAIKTLIT